MLVNPTADQLEILACVKLVIFDFDGVFTDNTVHVDQRGIESVRCWRSDGLGLKRITKLGIPSVIISTETNPVVQQRGMKLGLPTKCAVEDKAAAVLQACEQFAVSPSSTAFVGNDINDIAAFEVVGLPIGVADAYPEVFPFVRLRTNRRGGFGAVREVCDWIYHARTAQETRASNE